MYKICKLSLSVCQDGDELTALHRVTKQSTYDISLFLFLYTIWINLSVLFTIGLYII